MLIDKHSIEMYCRGFFGYGNLQSNLWFIGMEEGGGEGLDELERRVKIWQKDRKPKAFDLAKFHEDVGIRYDFFDPQGAVIQRTWNKLIEAILSFADVEAPSLEDRRAYQAHCLGRSNCNHALLELLPLPSRSQSELGFRELGFSWSVSRTAYEKHWRDERQVLLSRLIDFHRPRVVVMYGKRYRNTWSQIAKGTIITQGQSPISKGVFDGILYIALPHPRTSRLEHWREVGRLASCFVNNKFKSTACMGERP